MYISSRFCRELLLPVLLTVTLPASWAYGGATDVLPSTLEPPGDRPIAQWRDTVWGEVVDEEPEHLAPDHAVFQYLIAVMDDAWKQWQTDYEALKTPEQIVARQKRQMAGFRKALGIDCIKRTPLNAKITGTLDGSGYRVEKVLFESLPGVFVTASLFLPDSEELSPPYPGVLVPCGHYHDTSKAHSEYQAMGTLLALEGMVALVFDPVEQGERITIPGLPGVHGHNAMHIGSVLVGRGTGFYETWDGIRAIDYLQSRAEVDSERIGVTGNSGGGTQTSLLIASDDRIRATAVSCFINRMASQVRNSVGDAEQHIFDQIRLGIDHPDYLMIQAPQTATLLLTSTHDFFDVYAAWFSHRYAKRLYCRLNAGERTAIFENDANHNYNRDQRIAVARWMSRWLADRDAAIVEPPLTLFSPDELKVTQAGRVSDLDGSRTIYAINQELADRYAAEREALWSGNQDRAREKLREVTRIDPLNDLPAPKVRSRGCILREGLTIRRLVLEAQPGLPLPALLYETQSSQNKPPVLIAYGAGKQAADDKAEELARQGHRVLSIDLPATGETGMGAGWNYQSRNFKCSKSLHMMGESFVSLRAEALLSATKYFEKKPIKLHAAGASALAALHAAALEPQLFSSVHLENLLSSYKAILHTVPPSQKHVGDVVRGALAVYDLPDLVESLGDMLEVGSTVEPARWP